MKKRFLPFSLLLVIMIFGQSVMADQIGHYVPRSKATATPEAYMRSMRVNQHTGLIDPALMIAASNQSSTAVRNSKGDNDIYWLSMGPDNMGGRTTSIVYHKDPATQRYHVYIGSMGGGVYCSYNSGITWRRVGDENLMVSCMVEAADGTIYVGTGDGNNSVSYNGLEDLSYTDCFVGSGLYKIKDDVLTRIESTKPSVVDTVVEWSYINDVAVSGNMVIVAANDGLKYSTDETTWQYAQYEGEDRVKVDLAGNAAEVKVAPDNTVIASVDGKVYIARNARLDQMICCSTDNGKDFVDSLGVIRNIANVTGIVDLAVAGTENDSIIIYAATIASSTGNHVQFYVSEDWCESWRVILPTPGSGLGNQVYEEKGMYNHGLVIDPKNYNRIYVCGYNLWRMDRPTTQVNGYFQAIKVSSYGSLHVGVNALAFDPRNSVSQAYVATDGGIYKAAPYGSYFVYSNCNRGYITTRCFNVAPSGKKTRILGGLVDHGPILIEGLEGTNNMETGDLLMPALTPAHYGAFVESYNAGPCAVSLIQPKGFFLTSMDGNIQRTESAGEDYDFSNFLPLLEGSSTDHFSFTFSGYRMPIVLWESFNDPNTIATVQYKCTEELAAGTVVQCYSNNAGYPFMYRLPVSMHVHPEDPNLNDSIDVPDPITSRLFVADDDAVFFSNNPIQFNSETNWYNIGAIGSSLGKPTCIAVSADGDMVLVGTAKGKVIRVTGMNDPVHPDSAEFAPVRTVMDVSSQCVTSVSILSNDANKAVVTLGNYGNESYVYYCDNMLSDEPTFTSKQGTGLPKMPVYSSVFTVAGDESHVLIGTEHGIFRTTNIAVGNPQWTPASTNMGDVPVMELKQQIVHQDVQQVTVLIDSVPTHVYYPGTDNQGVIYAATYGRGLFRCETYHVQYSNTSVEETPVAAKSNVSMYPNPISNGEAHVSFSLNADANVSYEVFDMTGRKVMVETLGRYGEGSHEVQVNVGGLTNGTYVLRLNAGTHTSCVKFMVF